MSEKDLSRSSQNVGELGGSVLWLDGPAMGVEDPVSNAVKEVAVVVELLVEVDLM
jgi:hypothetical protein